MRTLISIPIIHTERDMGSLLEKVKQEYVQRYGPAKWEEHLKSIDEVWTEIRRIIEGLDLPYTTVRLYQDGLPVCGREALIVKEVAAQGSKNHQLLLELMKRGATVMGTEDPELLLQEYQLLQGAFGPGTSPETDRTRLLQEERSRSLLAERDCYIARRINTTLLSGEIGLLFLGVAHSVEKLLDTDILVRNLLPALRAGDTATE